MPLIAKLPRELENGEALITRRAKAAARKDLWRDYYRECYEYTMPQRETFNFYAPGQRKNLHLYDSTGQEMTYLAANNAQALLCPSWKHWAQLAPGGDIPKEEREDPDVVEQLQEATDILFNYINHSNFSTIIPEVLLDFMVGTCALTIDEGEDDDPLVFDAIPLSTIELEEGPNSRIETTWMKRTPLARNLIRTYPGMKMADLPASLQEQIRKKPDTEASVIQGCVYHPKDRHYYGVVVHEASKAIIWRYDYEDSSPKIVARASVVAGEIYGRGRVMIALPNIKTLNVMQEYILRQSALQVAPPYTAVSDGVLNPYTAQLVPGSVIPVASNDNSNPSLRVLETGGNFVITDAIMENLRATVRRILLGPQPNDGPVKSATEWAITDRNRLWDMGSEFGRSQAELFSPIIARCVWILQKRGKMPRIKVDGKMVTLKYASPLARAQDQEDLLAMGQSLELMTAAAQAGGEAAMAAIATALKFEALPAWITKRTGLDASLVRSESEQKQVATTAVQLAQQAQAAEAGVVPPSNVTPMRRAA
jgi:hypothetical protein